MIATWGTMPISAMPAAPTMPIQKYSCQIDEIVEANPRPTSKHDTAEYQCFATADAIDQSAGIGQTSAFENDRQRNRPRRGRPGPPKGVEHRDEEHAKSAVQAAPDSDVQEGQSYETIPFHRGGRRSDCVAHDKKP